MGGTKTLRPGETPVPEFVDPRTLEIMLHLRGFARGLPEAIEEFPWGHPAVKVRKKAFIFFSDEANLTAGVGFSVKLPHSGTLALELPFTTPTGYGLGQSGWVSFRMTPDQMPPAEVVQSWILESYRAVAPKSLGELVPTP